jgi:hypothetical protein
MEKGWRKSASFVFTVLILSLFICCQPKKHAGKSTSELDETSVRASFQGWQIIGEGTDFLTVKIDAPEGMPEGAAMSGLILDKDKMPLQKVSGYSFKPELEGKNHLWFYFFLYSPREIPSHLRQSEFIKLICSKNGGVLVDAELKYSKLWGAKPGETKIFDAPVPPDRIKGFLLLKDYTFLAEGDFRKPDGYYVEGEITGEKGRWQSFHAVSEIKGTEPPVELKMPSSRGWLELQTGRTHAMQEAVSPAQPYVEGWWDGKGYFHPDAFEVHGLKD